MREINLNRQKLGLEDLLFGVGIVTQIRAGQNVDVTRINASNLPFSETQTLFEWAQSINLEALGSITTELQAIYDNLTTIGNVEDNLTVISTLGTNITALNSLYTNISKLQNIDTNISMLQNIDTNMSKLQNLDTNMSKLQAIYTDLTKLESIYDNLTMLTAIYNNLTALNNINSQVIPNLTELLLVNDNAVQVAADKLTVSTDKGIVAGYKDDVSSMKVAVESIYDTFDDRFLGVKTNDPTVDNDGNALQDGAMYFNDSSNSLKVYSLDNTTWYTIPQIYLSGLLDVTLTSITTGDILTWNGTKWVNTRTPSFDSVKLNGGTGIAGTATWNNTELTYDLVLNNNVTLQVGQEEVVYCKNNTLTTIPNGKPVMAVGTNGNSGNIQIALHDGTKASAKRIIGITTQAILPSNNANPYGFVTRNGKVRGLNTTGSEYGETWVDGDILYVKATGALTKVEPVDTTLKMPIAFVIHAHSNGTLYVRTTGIDENHDRDFINDLVNIHSKTAKIAPVDADEFMLGDSASTWSLKKITWANIKTALNSLFTPRVATTTNKAIARYNSTTGDLQNSAITIDDSGNIGSGTQSFNGFGGSGFKNHIINGNFDVWQRGTSFSAAGFTADRWFITTSVNSQRIALSPAETDLTGATYALRFNAGTYVSYKIEEVRTLAGKKATLSFWSRSSASKTLYNLYIRQYFGTGGSTLVDTPFSSTTFNNTTGLTKHTFTVTLPTIAGKTIGSDNTHYIEIFFESQNDGIYTDITGVQLEEGSIATPFENRLYGLELSLCQRYYETGFFAVTAGTIGTGMSLATNIVYKNTKRISATVVYSGVAYTNCSNIATNLNSIILVAPMLNVLTGGYAYATGIYTASSEL